MLYFQNCDEIEIFSPNQGSTKTRIHENKTNTNLDEILFTKSDPSGSGSAMK